jgi:hypothetical protein
LEDFSSFTFLARLRVAVTKNGKVLKCAVGREGLGMFNVYSKLSYLNRQRVSGNDLRANEGRETKALNCKPVTNLKEKSELSNYCKTSGFRLHAVSGSLFLFLIYLSSFCM